MMVNSLNIFTLSFCHLAESQLCCWPCIPSQGCGSDSCQSQRWKLCWSCLPSTKAHVSSIPSWSISRTSWFRSWYWNLFNMRTTYDVKCHTFDMHMHHQLENSNLRYRQIKPSHANYDASYWGPLFGESNLSSMIDI